MVAAEIDGMVVLVTVGAAVSVLLSNIGDDLEGFRPLVGVVYMAPTCIAENQSRTCRTVVR